MALLEIKALDGLVVKELLKSCYSEKERSCSITLLSYNDP